LEILERSESDILPPTPQPWLLGTCSDNSQRQQVA